MSRNSAKSLAKTAVLDASDKPEDQDEARKRRVKMDFASWRKQTKAGKTTHQEEVGISSAAAMAKARKEAELKAKEEAAVKKQKEATKKEEVQVEAKVDTGDDVEREEGRNKRRFGTKGNYGHTLVRRRMHRANRGDKKIRGNKEVNVATGKVGKEIGEATRYSKETGKNLKSGKPYVKGGTAKGDTVYKSVLAKIKKDFGSNSVQQSSKQQKKVKGDKTRRQVGDRKFTPADTIAKKRAAQAAYIKSRSTD